jgi:glucoamylase
MTPALAAERKTLGESMQPLKHRLQNSNATVPCWKDSVRLLKQNIQANGAVAAAGGENNPEYPFHWIRDAAITMRVWAEKLMRFSMENLTELERHDLIETLEHFKKYAEFTKLNQQTATVKVNAEGELQYDHAGKLLKEINFGEPKFGLDGISFDGHWGRPQNDGPALRALALGRFKKFIDTHVEHQVIKEVFEDPEKFSRSLYDGNGFASTIKADLEYISHNWRNASYDVWEEVKGDHFYTRIVQMKSLFEGAKIAELAGDHHAAEHYRRQGALIESELSHHWDPDASIIRATRNSHPRWADFKRSGLDSAVILGVLHSDGATNIFTATDDRVLATAHQLEIIFQKSYEINKRFKNAVAIGRYPEDRYCGRPHRMGGGNPWVLLTNSFAEYYYKVSEEFQKSGTVTITSINVGFFGHLLCGDTVRQGDIISRESLLFERIQAALVAKGDDFIAVVKSFSPSGTQHEQIDRNTGEFVGAENLTWNSGSFLSAIWMKLAL